MKDRIEQIVGETEIYKARKDEFDTDDKVPFRVSPTPFILTPEQKTEVENIGNDIVAYFKAIDELYRTDSEVQGILNTGKPELFLVQTPTKYLFVRPDIIITPEGFRICEIETSPFGLGLAEVLNRAYRQGGFETLVADGSLETLVHAHTPSEGRIVFTSKTDQYAGQMTFLADKVFSGKDREWSAAKVNDLTPDELENIYRGFYLSEYVQDDAVKALLEKQIGEARDILPSPTPHMEEKAILAFIWDSRFETHLRSRLGDAAFKHLREVIPPNWIVGQEEHFAPGLPGNMNSSTGLASLSRSKRAFVLKPSGFSDTSSWAEGVNFLHKKSGESATQLLNTAIDDKTALHVIQEFKKGSINPMSYSDESGKIVHMSARVRLTPYFSATSGDEGRLVAIKATGRENTDLIHGSSDSINTAVS